MSSDDLIPTAPTTPLRPITRARRTGDQPTALGGVPLKRAVPAPLDLALYLYAGTADSGLARDSPKSHHAAGIHAFLLGRYS